MLRGGEAGEFAGSGSPLEGVSSAVSISAVSREPMSMWWGGASETKETAPCKDRCFFSSSPVGYKGQRGASVDNENLLYTVRSHS